MKQISKVFLLIGLMLLAAAIAGCGGSGGSKKTHNLNSPWYGDLRGIDTEPYDEETNIATDSWIHVFWPDSNYPPPRTFTVRLEKEERPGVWGAVHTIYKSRNSDPEGGSWWFEPRSYFSYLTWYRIVVTDTGGGIYMAYFRTSATRAPAVLSGDDAAGEPESRYRPAGAEDAPPSGEQGATQHTIITRE